MVTFVNPSGHSVVLCFKAMLTEKKQLLFSARRVFSSLRNCTLKRRRWPTPLLSVHQILSGSRALASVFLTGTSLQLSEDSILPCHLTRAQTQVNLWQWASVHRKADPSERLFFPSKSIFCLYLMSSARGLALLFASFAVSLSSKQFLMGILIKPFTLLCAQVNIVCCLPPLRSGLPPTLTLLLHAKKPNTLTPNKESALPRLISFPFILWNIYTLFTQYQPVGSRYKQSWNVCFIGSPRVASNWPNAQAKSAVSEISQYN